MNDSMISRNEEGEEAEEEEVAQAEEEAQVEGESQVEEEAQEEEAQVEEAQEEKEAQKKGMKSHIPIIYTVSSSIYLYFQHKCSILLHYSPLSIT